MKTPGQAAYEKWRNLLLGKDAHWDRLRDSDKAHWEAVAEAAIEHEHKPGCPGCPCR